MVVVVVAVVDVGGGIEMSGGEWVKFALNDVC